jgi:signal transduction histidine kinase
VNALAIPQPRPRLAWPAGDLLLAAGVATASLLDVWAPLPFVGDQQHRGALTAVFLASAAALLWRRRAPLAVLAFVYTVASLLYVVLDEAPEALGTFLPPLVAIYAAGRYGDARSLVLAGPLVLLGTAVHELQDPDFRLSGPTIFFWTLLVAAWPLGRAFRRRDEAVVALEEERAAAVAAERGRIARELHDVVGHGVSVVVLQLVAAEGMLDGGDVAGARTRLDATERSARQALAEMRRLVGLLDEQDAALAPQPGLAELDRLVADTRAAGVPVELTVRGEPGELPAGLELAIFRVAQEALTNVIRHAQPAHASIELSCAPRQVTLEIADDGATAPGPPGRGIAGMHERVALYGGELMVGRRPGGGFAVAARFPVEAA